MAEEYYTSSWRSWIDGVFPSCAILNAAVAIQAIQRRMPDSGAAELMRLAVEAGSRDEYVIALCRMLFASNSGEPLRAPALGRPHFVGSSNALDWPLAPIHIHKNVPFYIVAGWTVGGCPEPATFYLAHCLQRGVWVNTQYQSMNREGIGRVAQDFVENGPWKQPLEPEQQSFVLNQGLAI